MSPEEKAEQERWKAESDLRTLVDAQGIRNDKERSAAAMKAAEEQRTALSKLKKDKPNGK
mgnify:CR=1 FL=1